MEIVLKTNELNQIEKENRLFKKGRRISCIGMIVKGSVGIKSDHVKRIAKAGEIIAIADVFGREYLADYITLEDTIFYAFPVYDAESLENFLSSNTEYRGIVIDSMTKELVDYAKEREYLYNRATELFMFLKKHYEIATREGMRNTEPDSILNEQPEELFNIEDDNSKIAFYQECAKVPLDTKKKFYYNSEVMVLYQAEDMSYVEQEMKESCSELLDYIKEMYQHYYSDDGENLFDREIRFAKTMKKNGKFQMEQFIRINDTKEKICMISREIAKRTGEKLLKNETVLDDKLSSVLNTPMASSQELAQMAEEEDSIEMLNHSLQQILDFAKIEKEEQKEIHTAIEEFIKVPDKMSTQDDVRRLKKKITTFFFDLYKKCLYPWLEDMPVPLAVRLFLNYGYMDERLLDKEQIAFLCDMINEKDEDLPCNIYRMPEWLKEIYEGRKDTSRNSFEQDFRDELREQKRTGKITEAQEKQFLEDKQRRVAFEVDNMFASNNKTVNGKLSTYVPILYKDQFYGDVERLYVTKRQLCDSIISLEEKDFTVFYREVMYTNPTLKIDRENVMKHVYPDIIICPIYGTTSSMWQEITGKRRDSPGRFIFPILIESDLDKAVTKAFGRFHWEYCRCEMGASWNNIQYKSLTSEYMDYIQYYRKNHDLSEEKRDKIRTQIQRARNNSREIFLSDYEVWIYSESKSALKLNKVSRQILATYCPFDKATRTFLKSNAAFEVAMQKQQRNFAEKAKEWELRIRRRENNDLEVPDEFRETYSYYADR